MIIAGFAVLFLILWAIVYATLPAIRHLGRQAAAFAARFTRFERVFSNAEKRFRIYVPVVVIVVAGALLTAWAGDLFLDLAVQVHSKSTSLEQRDLYIHDWAVTRRNSGATTFFVAMTLLGGPAGLAVLIVSVAVLLLVRHRYRWLIYLLVTVGGGTLLNLGLKHYFARARPNVAEMLRRAHGYSFPSGHAMGSTVGIGLLGYAFMLRDRRRWEKILIVLLLGAWVLSIGFSRVYLRAHWLSDVLWASPITLVTSCNEVTGCVRQRAIFSMKGRLASKNNGS